MHRPLRLVFLSATVFLVLLPLAVARPGMPPTLKADEPAYFAAALSLVYDGDLVCDRGDLRRLFDRYPLLPVENLILMSDDGWQTARFGKPYLYSLLVAPAAALFGDRGVVAFNMVLVLGLVVIGFRTLRHHNDDGLAALFSAAFFFLGPAFVYAFWLQPEVLNMFGIAACLYLGCVPPPAGATGANGRWRAAWLSWGRTAASASALALAVYHKPMFALLGVPVLWSLGRCRGWRQVAAWCAAAVGSMAAIAGLSILLSGSPSAYLGSARAGVKIEDPERLEQTLAPLVSMSQHAMAEDEIPLASFGWLIRIPELFPALLKVNLGYFLWGRHTGFLLYMPFAALAILLFLINDRRSMERWLVLGSSFAIGVFFLIWIHYNWHGGSGFVGNRYFASVYPAFLFLVTRVRPAWSVVAGAIVAGLFTGPMLFTPYGAPVPDSTLQAHARGAAFEVFPTELSIRGKVPGYETTTVAGVAFRARQDLVEDPSPGSGALWVRGAATTEIWALSAEPLDSLLFEVYSPAADNEVTVRLGREKKKLAFGGDGDGEPERRLLELTPRRPSKTWLQYGKRVNGYRLRVSPSTGRNPRRPDGQLIEPSFYLGAQLTYLGTRQQLGRKAYYRLAWGEPELPDRVAPGATFDAVVTVRNETAEAWPVTGVLAIRLRHRWLHGDGDGDGEPLAAAGITPLPRRLTPGSWSRVVVPLTAPAREGGYILEFDAEREGLASFSERGAPVLRVDVDVAP